MTCPPLPTITKNLALASDWDAARAHFTCKIKQETGGIWTTAQHADREQRTKNWIYAQLAKHAAPILSTAGAEYVAKTLKEIKAYTPPQGTPFREVRTVSPPTMPTAPAPANVIPEKKLTEILPMKTGLGSLVGAGVGSVIPGVGTTVGGVLGGLLGGLGGLGASKCPGPYNYNPLTGGCDPKPGYLGGNKGAGLGLTGGGCPEGWTWDGTQCKQGGLGGFAARVIPGGSTGYAPAGQYTATDSPLGAGYVPLQRTQTVLMCPEGYVLVGNRSGKNPGMEVCLPKGMPGVRAARKWKPEPRPVMSAQDKMTLAKAKRLQNKAKRVAMSAGFTVKKR